jgi:hypothetical protein
MGCRFQLGVLFESFTELLGERGVLLLELGDLLFCH